MDAIQFRVVLLGVAVATMASIGCFNSGPPENQKISAGEAKLLSKVGLKYDQLHWFLDEGERPALEAVHDKYKAELKDWYSENGEAVGKVGKALVNFMKTKNQSKARNAIKQAKKDDTQELIRERDRILKEYEAAVIASVPPEKFELWQADKISRTMFEFLQPLNLTDGQREEVHCLAFTALKQLRKKDASVWHPVAATNLERLVGQKVLTPVQKPKFEALKKKHRLRKLKWTL